MVSKMEKALAALSSIDPQRRELYEKLVVIGFYPPPLDRAKVFEATGPDSLPFMALPHDGKLPLRAKAKFTYNPERTTLKKR